MEAVAGWSIGVWIVGMIGCTLVYRVRAGISVFEWGFHMLFKYGMGWTLLTSVKMAFWPIVLVHWLATGRPEPRYVFNNKAAARERAMHVAQYQSVPAKASPPRT